MTGSAGLVGSEAVRFFSSVGLRVVEMDNYMRSCFFGSEASTKSSEAELKKSIPSYEFHHADIRDLAQIEKIFIRYGGDVSLIVHQTAL